jgi:hypothetical protein
MLTRALCFLLFFLAASPAFAQSTPEAQRKAQVGWYKTLGGWGAAGVGAIFMKAGSAEDAFTGDRKTGMLVGGVALLGGGIYLLVDGYRDIRDAKRMQVGFTVGKKRASVVLRRSW